LIYFQSFSEYFYSLIDFSWICLGWYCFSNKNQIKFDFFYLKLFIYIFIEFFNILILKVFKKKKKYIILIYFQIKILQLLSNFKSNLNSACGCQLFHFHYNLLLYHVDASSQQLSYIPLASNSMPLQNIKGSSASLVIINFIFSQIHVLFIETINLITPKKKNK